MNRPSDVSGPVSGDNSERQDDSFQKQVTLGETRRQCDFTHRYWPPESIRYISSTVNLLLVSFVGLQHRKTGNNKQEIISALQPSDGS